MSFGVLNKTSCYLAGPMQYTNGRAWRNEIKLQLQWRGIRVFDPYEKPFLWSHNVDESEKSRDELLAALSRSEFDTVAERMKLVRASDLNLVDRSDFIVCYLNPTVPTIGTIEELVTAVRMKKPIFLIIEGGKQKCPLWVFGMIPHKYIYGSVEDALETIINIDIGVIQIDSDRWRLLKPEYR